MAEFPAVPDGTIEWVELTLRLDATITVETAGGGASEWIKPGAEGRIRMRGVPTGGQLSDGYRYIQQGILAPALEEVIVQIQQRLAETHRLS